ncbi:hypothetical protein TruAng_005367 [Truncatella angustata]|nr:hypothetical protein TruAng_005367 [Truncatella angustata]
MRSWLAVLPALLHLSSAGDADFDWDSITPSHNLTYAPCYEKFQCARLLVPLDWQDESNPHTVALAIAKLPATVSDHDPTFGGTIFTNPGGPGGSGVDFVLRAGEKLQNATRGNRNYEILSWDPRGIAFTSPNADCFQGDTAARDLAELQLRTIGGLDASENALRRQWARAQAYGQLCELAAKNASSILPHLTTPSVVRDMVAILDQIHAGRDAAAVAHMDEDVRERRIELKKREADVPRIQYWGFSYGSILGNTFASMYPGRVGRLIVDGIADADDYMRGTWLTNLQDTEAIVDYFYKSCFEQGDKCPLKRSPDTKWQDLKQRVDDFISQTDENPISVLTDKKIVVITGTEVNNAFIKPVYGPFKLFRPLAELLSGTLEGNYTLLLSELEAKAPRLHDSCVLLNSSATALLSQDAQHAIKCADGEDETKHGLGYFKSYMEDLRSQSHTLGAYWTTIRFACSGWTIRPKWRFTGPFTTPAHDAALVEGKPAAPLLFLSTRLDPVTPLRNAVNMASKHPGAAWVVQETTGHCTLGAPSKCISNIVQEYLEHGKVPESGTSCPSDCDPWNPCPEETENLVVNFADVHDGLLRRGRLGF